MRCITSGWSKDTFPSADFLASGHRIQVNALERAGTSDGGNFSEYSQVYILHEMRVCLPHRGEKYWNDYELSGNTGPEKSLCYQERKRVVYLTRLQRQKPFRKKVASPISPSSLQQMSINNCTRWLSETSMTGTR